MQGSKQHLSFFPHRYTSLSITTIGQNFLDPHQLLSLYLLPTTSSQQIAKAKTPPFVSSLSSGICLSPHLLTIILPQLTNVSLLSLQDHRQGPAPFPSPLNINSPLRNNLKSRNSLPLLGPPPRSLTSSDSLSVPIFSTKRT